MCINAGMKFAFSVLAVLLVCPLPGSAEEKAPDVDALMAQITHEKAIVRNMALRQLCEIGPGLHKRVPELIQILEDPEGAHYYAAEILGSMGPLAHAAIPALIRTIDVDHPSVRRNVWAALQEIGPAREETVPELVDVLKNGKDFYIRLHAANALGDMGDFATAAVPALIERLAAENGQERESVIVALGDIGMTATNAIPHLIPLFADDYRHVPHHVMKALEKYGTAPIVPLLEALETAEGDMRDEIIEAFRYMGVWDHEKKPAYQALIVTLEPEQQKVVRRLMNLPAPPVVVAHTPPVVPAQELQMADPPPVDRSVLDPILDEIQNGETPRDRKTAMRKLYDVAVDPAELLPILMKAAKDQDADVRAVAIRELGNLGSAAVPAIPLMLQASLDHSMWGFGQTPVHEAAVPAVVSVGKPAIPTLLEILESGEAKLREPAARALLQMGKDAEEHLPLLEKHSQEMSGSIAVQLIVTRLSLNPDDEELFAELVSAYKAHVKHADGNATCCKRIGHGTQEFAYYIAARALVGYGQRANEPLVKMLKEAEDRDVSSKVLYTLQSINQPDAATVDAIAEMLKDPEWVVVATAAQILSHFGASARRAIPALGDAYVIEDRYARQQIREALKKLHAVR